MPKTLAQLIATFFYVGDLPFAAGTIASFLGLLLSIALGNNIWLYLGATTLVVMLGFISCQNIETILNEKDPSKVVVDEVAGALIAFWGLPINFSILITAFFLFRAFDMFKIFPVNKLEFSAGYKSIMLDDIFAGIYTSLIMHAVLYLRTVL